MWKRNSLTDLSQQIPPKHWQNSKLMHIPNLWQRTRYSSPPTPLWCSTAAYSANPKVSKMQPWATALALCAKVTIPPGYYWSATCSAPGNNDSRYLCFLSGFVYLRDIIHRSFGSSVRLVKDIVD